VHRVPAGHALMQEAPDDVLRALRAAFGGAADQAGLELT